MATALSFHSPDTDFRSLFLSQTEGRRITDRNGAPLTLSYQSDWNTDDILALHAFPDLLRSAFLLSEDRRFFDHSGVDWRARAGALWQNIRHGQTVRGASTITEQVIRILHPRPRTLWSKWIEGMEAVALERTTSKATILEFYLNQVPYAANRRGIVQAARYYFDRDPSTLSPRELLALVVLARAPSGYDLYRNPGQVGRKIDSLANQAHLRGLIDSQTLQTIHSARLAPTLPPDPVESRHFTRQVRLQNADFPGKSPIRSTLDATLQTRAQTLLDRRVKSLSHRNVHNAAALVVDRHSGDVLAWVVSGATRRPDQKIPLPPGAEIDTVTTPRQPGSALKPFLYGLALEKGWTAGTMIDDSPLAEAIGSGLHRFRNYSNVHYGPIPLREALGNSLNIPALRTIRHVGTQNYLNTLHALGFDMLDRGAAVYDEGLALGDGEVSLFALVQAYTALANGGLFRPLRLSLSPDRKRESRRIYSIETASLLANILSDPTARQIEFGSDSVLNLPVQTAAKTGTSTGYRDAWVAGFDDRYVVGIWMGNLDRSPMDTVTGSTGPALTMRSLFALLNRDGQTRPLYLSPRLHQAQSCIRPGTTSTPCALRTEWFAPGTHDEGAPLSSLPGRPLELVRPTEGLHIAQDPRIPEKYQKFRFELAGLMPGQKAQWTLDGAFLGTTPDGKFLWPVKKGAHRLSVSVSESPSRAAPQTLPLVHFIVK
ncbi:MAG: transglycosylase domain-containing protein [Rhodospirillales bacterium]|nr:transglycosylase domain-containing protein [Rhodospirillales bacterium]